MKRVLIFYFSGTGNTKEVADMIASSLRNAGTETDCYAIDICVKKGIVPDVSGADAIGIGYPIYAFNAPGLVESFLKKLPLAKGLPAFVFKTAGEPLSINNASSFWIHCILKKKGYRLMYERHFLMPYNIKFRFPDEVVKQIYTLSKKLAVKLAYDFMQGISDGPRYNLPALLVAWIMLVFRPLAKFNGKMYKVSGQCTQCQKCIRGCPMGNICLREGKIIFGWKCTMCMHCVMYCPQGAMHAGWIDGLSVRGGYNFERIMNDEGIKADTIQKYKKGFYTLFKKYIKKMEAITENTAQ
ncbi:MAG: EFR1 family ferrodoxin [Eubacteriales bacterium]